MSKGYGVCQRLIMDKLNSLGECDYIHLVDLLPNFYEAKNYQALNRAAKTLQKVGKLNLSYASRHYSAKGFAFLVVHHIGTEIALVPNPKAGTERENGYRYPPVIYKCILRNNCDRIDT